MRVCLQTKYLVSLKLGTWDIVGAVVPKCSGLCLNVRTQSHVTVTLFRDLQMKTFLTACLISCFHGKKMRSIEASPREGKQKMTTVFLMIILPESATKQPWKTERVK